MSAAAFERQFGHQQSQGTDRLGRQILFRFIGARDHQHDLAAAAIFVLAQPDQHLGGRQTVDRLEGLGQLAAHHHLAFAENADDCFHRVLHPTRGFVEHQ